VTNADTVYLAPAMAARHERIIYVHRPAVQQQQVSEHVSLAAVEQTAEIQDSHQLMMKQQGQTAYMSTGAMQLKEELAYIPSATAQRKEETVYVKPSMVRREEETVYAQQPLAESGPMTNSIDRQSKSADAAAAAGDAAGLKSGNASTGAQGSSLGSSINDNMNMEYQ
jgi:hypothetical protein